MSDRVTQIMELARRLADIQVEHRLAVRAYSAGEADFDSISALSEQWTEAEKELRASIEEALR